MKIVIDMNLSPQWVSILKSAGYEAIHWSKVGAANAPDREIMEWERTNNHVIFTHDLDFDAILAATDANSPSVLQIRAQDVSPKTLSTVVLSSMKQFEERLRARAKITSQNWRTDLGRICPIRKRKTTGIAGLFRGFGG